jgi:hypothetical protein
MKPVLDLEILIATKDRSSNLERLLASINDSSSLPKKVIIVYAGNSVDRVVKNFKNFFSIQLIYSEVASQVKQKQLGIELLDKDCKWVLFLDDDVELEEFTLENLFSKYLHDDSLNEYSGFGLALRDFKERKINILLKIFLMMFQIYSFKPGSLMISGHPQIYLDQKVNCQVYWLNGISVWRFDKLHLYSSNLAYLPYSAYEDVIFSYKVSKNSKLMFVADIFVKNQRQQTYNKMDKNQFIYGALLRYYFVSSNLEFSKFWLLISQVARSVDYIALGSDHISVLRRIDCAQRVWFTLLVASIKRVDGMTLMKNKLQTFSNHI